MTMLQAYTPSTPHFSLPSVRFFCLHAPHIDQQAMLNAPAITESQPMTRSPYSLVEPEQFTDEHRSFIERFAKTVEAASSGSALIAGAKDIQSRHLAASDRLARIVGLARGQDVAGRMDSDMPCEGTAAFADCFVREDRRLLQAGNIGAQKSVLNIHRYDTGFGALVFDKFLLKHHPSRSILGVVYHARETELGRFTALFPSYWSQFGEGCSIERAECETIEGVAQLSEAEYEIAFLVALGYSAEAIACVLPRLHPNAHDDVSATLSELTEKMTIAGVTVANMRDCLIEARIHQRMPRSFFDQVVRSPA
jgi:hypothetical protein